MQKAAHASIILSPETESAQAEHSIFQLHDSDSISLLHVPSLSDEQTEQRQVSEEEASWAIHQLRKRQTGYCQKQGKRLCESGGQQQG